MYSKHTSDASFMNISLYILGNTRIFKILVTPNAAANFGRLFIKLTSEAEASLLKSRTLIVLI
jgi:hypothetical protein